MTALLPALFAAGWAIAALPIRGDRPFESARAGLTRLFAISAVITGASWLWTDPGISAVELELLDWPLRWTMAGFLGSVPVVLSLVGLVAVSLADSLSHSTRTLRRMLLLLAIAMGFVSTHQPAVLAALWAGSPIVAWRELRSRPESIGVARLMAVYHGLSAVSFLVAVTTGFPGHAIWPCALALAAIGLREAVIPGHSWFVRFVETAPMGLVVAFVGPQLGVYAHVELLHSGVPEALGAAVGAFGALTAIVAALLGIAQTSLRRSLAYLMMSQTGLAAFGLQNSSEVAFAGSLLLWQVLALATSGLAMTVSALEGRRGGLDLSRFTGCFSRTPRMAAGFLTMGLASVGFPMTLGFVAEDLLVQGSVGATPTFALVLILATAINGINVMRCFFRLFSGQRTHSGEVDLTTREAWALSVILAMLLLGGLAPGVVTSREFGPAEASVGRSGLHAERRITDAEDRARPHASRHPRRAISGRAARASRPEVGSR